MSALYRLNYTGSHSEGFAVVYIGRGLILGMDEGKGHLRGTYVEEAGRLKGAITGTATEANRLASGQFMQAGESTEITIDWSSDFATGSPQPSYVMGDLVEVTFEKIGDIP
jgi:hypothetical protein